MRPDLVNHPVNNAWYKANETLGKRRSIIGGYKIMVYKSWGQCQHWKEKKNAIVNTIPIHMAHAHTFKT